MSAAILLGKQGGRWLSFPGSEHAALYAPTRSGKGVGYVIPNCLAWPHSIVVLDVKRENWQATAGYRSKVLCNETHLFDPLAADGCTARYNPLSYIDRTAPDRFDQVQKVGQALFAESTGAAKFWDDAGRSAFNGACCFVAETPEIPLTIAQVLRLFTAAGAGDLMRRNIAARRKAGSPYSLACVDSVSDYLTGGIELVNGIRKTVTTRLAMWNNPRVACATEVSDFDLRQLRARPISIYVGVSPDNIERLRPLLTLFFQQLVDLNVRVHPSLDPTYRHQCLIVLDEFPVLGAMPHLANAFSYVAGYGLRMLVICQSRSQLRDANLYGTEVANVIFDNCGVEAVFGAKNNDLCKELSERTGYNTVDSVTRQAPRWFAAWKPHKQSLAAHPHSRAMLLPQEIMRLPSTEQIIFRAGLPPIAATKIRWYEDTDLRLRVRPPPRVAPIEISVPMDDGGSFPQARQKHSARRPTQDLGRGHWNEDEEQEISRAQEPRR